MPRRSSKDIIHDLLLSSDTPLSAEDISDSWPYAEGLSISRLAQLLHRMKYVEKVGVGTSASVLGHDYDVALWTHIRHERYSEWVEKSTNE